MDPHLELQLFEKDVDKMFDWIRSNRDLFMTKYTRVGRKSAEAKSLQDEHAYFQSVSLNVSVNVKRLQEVAARLVSSGHYASARIQSVASRLDRCWKEFTLSLEERSVVLQLAITFYQRAENFLRNVSGWSKDVELTPGTVIPSDVNRLEEMVHRHQSLFETINKVYEEVHNARKKLLNQLEHFVQFCYQCKFTSPSQSSSSQSGQSATASQRRNPSHDYNDAAKHIATLSHEINAHYREVESIWSVKKIKLHQRLALALFQDDVRQVIDWIDTHGEGFLKKNIAIGKNLARARLLFKSHQTFETVAQNTYTNGAKLLAAAEEFAQTGECNPEEIYRVAERLEGHVRKFAERVERRRQVLHMTVLFYQHDKEICGWLDQMRQEATTDEPLEAPASVEACETALDAATSGKEALLDAINSTISEGETLIGFLRDQLPPGSESDSTGASDGQHPHHSDNPPNGAHSTSDSSSVAAQESPTADALNSNTAANLRASLSAIEQIVDKLKRVRPEAEDLANNRKLKYEMCLQLRLYERDAMNICNQFESWSDESDGAVQRKHSNKQPGDVGTAERTLQVHNDSFTRLQQLTFDFLQRGQQLAQLFESCPSISVYADLISDQTNAGAAGDSQSHQSTQSNTGQSTSSTIAGSGGGNGSANASRSSSALQRIQAILEYVHEREMDLEDITELRRMRLEENVQVSVSLHREPFTIMRLFSGTFLSAKSILLYKVLCVCVCKAT